MLGGTFSTNNECVAGCVQQASLVVVTFISAVAFKRYKDSYQIGRALPDQM